MEKKLYLLWSAIHRDDDAGVLGIHGTAGVGKSRLLRRLREKIQRQHKGDQAQDGEARHFDVVLTVEASEESTERSVLADIARQLEIAAASGDSDSPGSLAADVRAALETQSFVIVLDGLWEPVSLESVGIPDPASGRPGSRKLVVSSRIKHVLTQMGATTVIPLDALSESDSWGMFVAAAGNDLDEDQELRGTAEDLVKKLGGTPLALQSVGQAMSSERSLAVWEKASSDMDTAPWDVPGMTPVLESLKRTYDNLRLPAAPAGGADGDRKTALLQSCVEYISLYGRGFSTYRSTLIDYWVGEGLIDGVDTMEEAIVIGEHLIETLIGSGMAGECTEEDRQWLTKSNWVVCQRGQMPDVVTPAGAAVKLNDPAFAMIVWIRSLEGKRWCMKPGAGLDDAPPRAEWEAADSVSLMRNSITELPAEELDCPELTWLMLWWNAFLSRIPDGFFRYMPNLRVLVLGGTQVNTLPPSIGDLRGLRYLDLQFMVELRSLPKELGNLVKLRFLTLDSTPLKFVPAGVFSQLQDLQVLRMTSSYPWGKGPVTAEEAEEQVVADESDGEVEGQENVDECDEEAGGQEAVEEGDMAGESDEELEGRETADDENLAGESDEGVEGQEMVDESHDEVEGQEAMDGKDLADESDKEPEGQETVDESNLAGQGTGDDLAGKSDEEVEVEGQEIVDDDDSSNEELQGQATVEDGDMADVEELTGLTKLKQVDTDLYTVRSLRALFSSPCTKDAVHSLSLVYAMDSLELDLVTDMGYTTTGPTSLRILNCQRLERLALGGPGATPEGKTYLDRLTYLTLDNAHTIPSIDCGPNTCLPNLRELIIVECYTLHETLFDGISNEEDDVERGKEPITMFPRLEVLRLKRLLNLESISKGRRLQFPALRNLKVKQCYKLQDLAFGNTTGLEIETIKGSRTWWNALRWSDDELKARFEPFFEEGVEEANYYGLEMAAQSYLDKAKEKKLAN